MSEDSSSKEEVDLAAIEARLAKITPGSWMYWNVDDKERFSVDVKDGSRYIALKVWDEPDADLIAHAPTDIAALLARARQQDARIAELEAEVRGFKKDDRKTMKAVNSARKQNRHLIAEVKRLRGKVGYWENNYRKCCETGEC
jgi:hypothetical protein